MAHVDWTTVLWLTLATSLVRRLAVIGWRRHRRAR